MRYVDWKLTRLKHFWGLYRSSRQSFVEGSTDRSITMRRGSVLVVAVVVAVIVTINASNGIIPCSFKSHAIWSYGHPNLAPTDSLHLRTLRLFMPWTLWNFQKVTNSGFLNIFCAHQLSFHLRFSSLVSLIKIPSTKCSIYKNGVLLSKVWCYGNKLLQTAVAHCSIVF